MHKTTQITTEQHKYKLMLKSVGRAPSLRVFTLAFSLQLSKEHGKTSVRVRKTSIRVRKFSVKLRKTSVEVQDAYHQKYQYHFTRYEYQLTSVNLLAPEFYI
jgi:hypothetical protein